MRELLAAVVKTAGGSMATLLMGMAVVKMLAVFVGPAGVGVFSLLRQTQQTAMVLGLLNGQAALVQGLASREGEARARYVSTVFWIGLLATAAVALVFLAAPGLLSRALTGSVDADTAAAFRFLAVPVVFGVFYTFAVSVLNGHRMIGRASLVQFVNFFTVAALAYPMIALAAAHTATTFVTLLAAGTLAAATLAAVFLWKERLLSVCWPRWTEATREAARHFVAFSFTLMISGVVSVAVPLIVRAMVVRGFGFARAGIFDAAWTLSMSYVLIILTSFSAYYLPTLSGLSDPAERVALIGRVLRLAVILMLPLVTAVIVLKPLVIQLLYSADFAPALALIRWMLIGDYFKVLSWVFSYTVLAYADMRTFVFTEVVWGLLTLGAAFASVRWLQSMEAIAVTFLLLYIAYYAFMARYVFTRHRFVMRRGEALSAVVGLTIIVVASLLTWNDTAVHWPRAVLSIAVAVVAAALMLSRDERRGALAWVRSRVGGTAA